MSKASEWANAYCAVMDSRIAPLNEQGQHPDGRGWRLMASVDTYGAPVIDSSGYPPTDAWAHCARWILDTFGEQS